VKQTRRESVQQRCVVPQKSKQDIRVLENELNRGFSLRSKAFFFFFFLTGW